MSQFGNFIAEQIATERRAGANTTAKSMAKRMDIAGAQISRVINGDRTSVSWETLLKMAHGLSDTPAIRAQFIACYLADQLHKLGDGAKLIEIRVQKTAATFRASDSGAANAKYDRLEQTAK